jgi:hypothetical protein
MVAERTCGHYVCPDVQTTQVAGENMVDRQVGQMPPAILAGKIVAAENFPPGEFNPGSRALHHVFQPDHGWTRVIL